jgi:hypothetical protein
MDEILKKYELIDEKNDHVGNRKVYRIKALRDFGSVKTGDVGGFVESEDNLSHSGDCWIFDDAYVIDKARVYDDARVCSDAWIFDNAEVFGEATISGSACVYHQGKVYGHAKVYDDSKVYNSAQVFDNAIVHGNARIKSTMKSSKPVTIIDNSEVVISIADDRIHVYQSTVYKKNQLPQKYMAILELLESSKDYSL